MHEENFNTSFMPFYVFDDTCTYVYVKKTFALLPHPRHAAAWGQQLQSPDLLPEDLSEGLDNLFHLLVCADRNSQILFDGG